MKGALSIVLAAALAFSLAACTGSPVLEPVAAPEPTAVPQPTATPEPTATPVLERTVVSWWNKSGDYEYNAYSDGTAEIARYGGGAVELTIPAELDGLIVTAIGKEAFLDCGLLTSVTIPEGVTSIGDSAFYHCEVLTSVTIPSGVTSIGDDAFCSCEALTGVVIPEGVTSIGDDAFLLCKALEHHDSDQRNEHWRFGV